MKEYIYGNVIKEGKETYEILSNNMVRMIKSIVFQSL